MSYPFFTWPVTVTSGSNVMVVAISGSEAEITLPAGTYRWESGGADDLGDALDTAIDSHGAGSVDVTLVDGAITPSWVTISATADMQIEWTTATTTLDAPFLGWSNSADTASSSPTVTGIYPPEGVWFPHRDAIEDHDRSHIRYARFQANDPSKSVTQVNATWTILPIRIGMIRVWRALQTHVDNSTYASAVGAYVASDPNIAFESSLWSALIADTGVYYHADGASGGDGPYYLRGVEAINLDDMMSPDPDAPVFYALRLELCR